MRIKLAGFLVFSLSILMIAPAYANVTTMSLGENTYPKDGKFIFTGNENEGSTSVFVIIRDSTGVFIGMLSDPSSDSDGTFSTLPRDVSQFFKSKGFFNATAFTDNQKEENGVTIKLEYDGDKIFVVPDFVLKLNPITDQIVEEKKTVTFTATLTESLADIVFSLEKNPPTGASIDSKTGKFLWTPTESQGPATYVFDIVAKKGVVEDRKTLKITVTEPAAPIIQPKPKVEPEPTVEPEEPEPTEVGIASFVDSTKDPQSYVDRYNNEPSYKKWFDANFPEYSSIYQAVGLEEPKGIAPFVDPTKDPQSYVDRYNNEPNYKKWFNTNFPEYSSIYEAVGLDEPKTDTPKTDTPKTDTPKFGICGSGTKLIDGVCTIIDMPKPKLKPWWQFW